MDLWARRWHALTAIVAVVALVLQFVLIIFGEPVLAEAATAGLPTRLGRFVSYFTIQSNALVAYAAITLARDPGRDGSVWRVLRAAGVAGITITGIVHFFLLRPLLDLDGLNYVCDKLLHMVVPVLAVVGWLAFGPRPRITLREVGWALLWPVVWLAWALAVGSLSGWFPYPFLDFDEEGLASVLVVSVGITALFFAVFGVIAFADRRLAPRPAPSM
ncbi:MAG: Pr6Pr family membrane protein [Nocardioides sp.]